ncbi:MAG TPA: CapA family protein [Candidatus Pacearchaeota archaeon]|nr:CapA family protein [Candidatus Pacearchaeota archaeon]HPR79965.1 CapA family protein [Candidatus Pacearchaeota archaeon]
MKGKILSIIFVAIFLFCGSQVFKPETAPADISSVVETPKQIEYKPESLLFVGDIMLDRGVERLMQKSSFSYPVDLIKDFLNSFDFVVGNLEGPINENPKDFSDSSLSFSFDKKSIESLKTGNFSLVSLANNHTLNMDWEGFDETKKILNENNIAFTGDPIDCDSDYIYQKDGIIYYGINVTFSNNCSDKEIAKQIKDIRSYNPETFLVVLIHWGTEYKTVDSKGQENLAHIMIDAGADLIIGSHPHVVQNIEQYNNKLIFYSLGNFIFDQYFSKDTQEGLGVGVEIYKDKKVYTLYPIINKSSQPKLMEEQDKIDFLNSLAEKSSEALRENIKNGKIEIKN